jgi:hypothetical protein
MWPIGQARQITDRREPIVAALRIVDTQGRLRIAVIAADESRGDVAPLVVDRERPAAGLGVSLDAADLPLVSLGDHVELEGEVAVSLELFEFSHVFPFASPTITSVSPANAQSRAISVNLCGLSSSAT